MLKRLGNAFCAHPHAYAKIFSLIPAPFCSVHGSLRIRLQCCLQRHSNSFNTLRGRTELQSGKLKKQTKEVSEIPQKLRLFIYYSWIDWIPLISCKQMSATKCANLPKGIGNPPWAGPQSSHSTSQHIHGILEWDLCDNFIKGFSASSQKKAERAERAERSFRKSPPQGAYRHSSPWPTGSMFGHARCVRQPSFVPIGATVSELGMQTGLGLRDGSGSNRWPAARADGAILSGSKSWVPPTF